jgi:4-hydroxyacetophenone monooxygenase
MKDTIPSQPLDADRLRRAVEDANIPTLAMVLFQLTGDRRWLKPPYKPARSRGLGPNDSGGLPDAAAADVRAAAIDAILAWADGRPAAVPVPESGLLREMLSICVAEEVPPEYERMMREEMGFEPVVAEAPRTEAARDFPVVIIGAGISGLVAALRLREAGIPFVVLERNDDVGGVWLTNTYPGAGVDTPSYLYAYSFHPHSWSTHFSRQAEVADYVADMADTYDLRRDIQFGVDVEHASYDEAAQRWTVTARDRDGGPATFEANAVITAVGLFNEPAIPALPGLDRFAGAVFHSAQWPDDVDLTGKRVAIVGTGASAMQIVPAIADQVAQLTVYQRSPQWIAPNAEYFQPVSDEVHWLMDNVPYYHVWYRFRLAWLFNDRVHPSLQIDPRWEYPERSLNAVNDGHRRYFTRYLKEQLAGREDLVRKSLPDYPPFGKRMLLDNGWYAALKRPNVELVTAAVTELGEHTVHDAEGGEREFDIVVLCTGFTTLDFLGTLEISGRRGEELHDLWGPDDASAYLGMTVPGFPNLFIMYGPNTGLGAGGSYIFVAECAARYIVTILSRMIDQGIGAIECRADVHEQWVRDVDAAHERMVWSHPGMSTYYRNRAGRIVTNLPWRVVDYWTLTRDVDFDAYDAEAVHGTEHAGAPEGAR